MSEPQEIPRATRLRALESNPRLDGLLRQAFGNGEPGAHAPAVSELDPPLELSERYADLRQIARGGMGVVFKGRDRVLARDVAIKVLQRRCLDRPRMGERFREEAQIGAQLAHPGIVPVHEVGVLADGRPFFTMKLVEGNTLADLLAERPEPGHERRRLLDVFAAVCQTIAYAHGRGVLHRDLKPENVMVGRYGEVQVMDWGLAKVLGIAPELQAPNPRETEAESPPETARSATAGSVHGSVFGTPAYMAPEQANGEVLNLDERTDVFALGAILCEMLTGRPPFAGDREQAKALARACDTREAFAALATCAADPELVTLAKHCLAADPDQRPVDAGEVARRVADYLSAVEARAKAAELRAAAAEERAAGERRLRLRTVVLTVLVLAAILVGIGIWIWAERREQGRREVTGRAIADALAEASIALPGIGLSPADELVAWTAALGPAQRAVELARIQGGDRAESHRAESLLQRVRDGMVRATKKRQDTVRDQTILERLHQARSAIGSESTWAEDEFTAVFSELGVVPGEKSVDENARVIRACAIAEELVAALDDWALCRQNLADSALLPNQLRDIASFADADEVRRHLRALIANPDLLAARASAEDLDPTQLPVATTLLLASALMKAGDRERSLGCLRRAQLAHPSDFWINWALAQESQDTRDAIRYYQAVLSGHPSSSAAAQNLAIQLANAGRNDEAEVLLRQAIRSCPQNGRAHKNLGVVLMNTAREAEAIEELTLAATLLPKDAACLFLAGKLYRQLDRFEDARSCYVKALERDPEHVATLKSLGVLLCDSLRLPAEAVPVFRRALERKPNDAEVLANLGGALLALGDQDGAAASCREALAAEPNYAHAAEVLGRVLIARGDLHGAKPMLERAVASDPKRAFAFCLLGEVCGKLGDRSGEVSAYRAAVALDSALVDARYNLGISLHGQEQFAEAILAFEEVLRRDPTNENAFRWANGARLAVNDQRGNAEAWCRLGKALQEKGRLGEALEAFQHGHRLGRSLPGWDLPSDQWCRECKRALDGLKK